MRPVLKINNHDYSEYIGELSPSREDLDADNSGRDIQTGQMIRTRIAIKQKWEVKMLRLSETLLKQLLADLNPQYYKATILDPTTNTQTQRTFYTSSVPFGVQRYNPSTQECYYDGVSFSMIER